jgi:hypothetical protein
MVERGHLSLPPIGETARIRRRERNNLRAVFPSALFTLAAIFKSSMLIIHEIAHKKVTGATRFKNTLLQIVVAERMGVST